MESSKSSDKKILLSNFASLFLLQIANYLFPLLTVPYLAHTIGVSRYGDIAFASAVMVYFQTVVDYGFVYSSVREIAKCQNEIDKISNIYSRVLFSRMLLALFSLSILLLLIISIPIFRENSLILLVSFLLVIGQALFPDWLFQGLERMKYITIFNVMIKSVFLVCVFVFIKSPNDYWMQPLFVSLGYIISGIIAVIIVRKWGIRLRRISFNEIKIGIKNNFDIFINQIVPTLYNATSIVLLQYMHGNVANGRYSAANQFNNAGSSLLQVLSRTFYPLMSRKIQKHNFYEKFTLSLGALMSISLIIIAPYIIEWLFPLSFYSAITILRIIALSLFFLAMIDVYGTNYLLAQGYDIIVRKITVFVSIPSLLIAIPLVYYFSANGVALVILISRAGIAVWEWIEVIIIKNKIKSQII